MAKKSIFSNPKPYKSKYYGQTEEQKKIRAERKQRAKEATEAFRRAGLKQEKTGKIAGERFKFIMDALPKEYADQIRNKVEEGEYYSSGDVLDAAQEIADAIEGNLYFSKYQIDKKLMEIKNRPATEDDMENLRRFMDNNPDL